MKHHQLAPDDERIESSDLMRTAYDTLRGLANAYLQKNRPDHTLQPTALVHEAYLKIAQSGRTPDWKSKTHFRAVAAAAMRQVLIDHARRRTAGLAMHYQPRNAAFGGISRMVARQESGRFWFW